MTASIAFYAGRALENTEWTLFEDLPEGAYIRSPSGSWAIKNIGLTYIPTEDVPKELRLMAALLNGGL